MIMLRSHSVPNRLSPDLARFANPCDYERWSAMEAKCNRSVPSCSMSLGPTDPQEKTHLAGQDLRNPWTNKTCSPRTKKIHLKDRRDVGAESCFAILIFRILSCQSPNCLTNTEAKSKSVNQYTSGVNTTLTGTSSTTAHRNTPDGKLRTDKIFAILESYGLCRNGFTKSNLCTKPLGFAIIQYGTITAQECVRERITQKHAFQNHMLGVLGLSVPFLNRRVRKKAKN